MQKKISIFLFMFLLASGLQLHAQYETSNPNFKECYIGSTFAMLGNFLPNNKPDFVQINLGYRLTGKDVVSLELKTWKYAWPLGIPYGPLKEAPETEFPGYIREYGFALAYQRFWRARTSFWV